MGFKVILAKEADKILLQTVKDIKVSVQACRDPVQIFVKKKR